MTQAPRLTLIFILYAVVEWGDNFVHSQDVPVEAVQFFNHVENAVELIASSARNNYRNRQELWNRCRQDGRCSVYSYNPLPLYSNNSMCLAVEFFNEDRFCQVSSRTSISCESVTVSTASTIRLPGRMNETQLSCDAEITICAQKDLDEQAFSKVYSLDYRPFRKVAWSYFAASNGIFRKFPGLEPPPKACNRRTYDPRKRPWYKAVTSVNKQVVLLLDTGGSMANALSLAEHSAVTIFTVAQAIATEFLDTLNKDDIVTVYSFDNIGVKKIGEKVLIPSNDTENEPTLWALKEAVNGTSVMPNALEANLTAALETVLLHGGFDNSTQSVQSLKMMLIITGGRLAEGVTVNITPSIIQAATTNQVRTFIYRLNDSSQDADSSDLADLQSVACSLEGSYNEISRRNIFNDPLSALTSFYSYVAALRFSLDGEKPLWVPSSKAFSLVGDVIVISFPVFEDGILLGVAAIDIITEEVKRTWPGAIDSWRKPAETKYNTGLPINCNVNRIPEAMECSDEPSSERGLCLENSLPSASNPLDYAARICCDDENTGGSGRRSSKVGIIAGVSGGAAVAIVIITLCIYYRSAGRLMKDHASSEALSTSLHPALTPRTIQAMVRASMH